ncbi:type I-C CRISPR-associated endonuclease Cas1c [Anaerolentibacter hominis]|uniref:type I-C CRISPR-associated endonuclease Cas1c n=1 Tax=Anaerolentibacter hominis TaxID=3079009 RepID=UPI0031B7F070
MRKILNTLYVTSADNYLSLDGENIVILEDGSELGRIPLHNLEAIVSFGYRGVSPALMGACAEHRIGLSFMTPQGKFLARITGPVKGNVVLRKNQYEAAKDSQICLQVARNCILGKIYNSRWILERATRDHRLQVDVDKLKQASQQLRQSLDYVKNTEDIDQLRGYEGEAASVYFGVMDELILQQQKEFQFHGRNKRPPLDKVNAMLSFVYTLLTTMVASALETVGLDPYVGFMHTIRPGRVSLALDLIEELRPALADRFVISLINRRVITAKGFRTKEDGAVIMEPDAKKVLLTEWQNRKKELITHPFLNEKVEWGMIPFVQATLLARYLRGDLDEYPPFFWK